MNAPHIHDAIVYVVDDDPEMREGLAWLLDSCELKCRLFESVKAFEHAMHSMSNEAGGPTMWPGQPSCLLLDVCMPGTNGLAFFERLVELEMTSRLPVIFLTGHGDLSRAVAAMRQGAFDYIEKPCVGNSLVDRAVDALIKSAEHIGRRPADSMSDVQ